MLQITPQMEVGTLTNNFRIFSLTYPPLSNRERELWWSDFVSVPLGRGWTLALQNEKPARHAAVRPPDGCETPTTVNSG